MINSYPDIQTRVSFVHGTHGKGGTVALDTNGRKVYLYDTTAKQLDSKRKIATLYYKGTQDELCVNLNNRAKAPNFTDQNGQDWAEPTMTDMIRHALELLDYKRKTCPVITINDAPDKTVSLVHNAVQHVIKKSTTQASLTPRTPR
jgi:hypothetical protein